MAKVARRNRQLEGQVESLRQPVEEGFVPPTYEDPSIQDAIDTVPQLVAWQYDPDAQDKFARAIEHDELLKVEPAWQNRPLADRLVEVTRRVLAEAAPAPQTQRKDPQAVIAAAPTQSPQQISDFKGGALPNKTEPDYSRMSDEEIIRSLPRM
ncbi:hypothetical protein RD110_15600 [Rhodoferax koreense]|uniref:Uncharacterized protein n=1 Tax=Rhodoferax koreensis TaxID=1842727 RepID=A0A1P8JXG5_9BURK|nr:hypothetical protein RD110_15600 [Rhodoferax koreense]